MLVLCLLISDQHIPNLLSVHHFRPDWLVLIESASKKISDKLIKALQLGGLNYDDKKTIFEIVNVTDMQEIEKSFNSALEMYKCDDWICNITGGTKPMSIGGYNLFKSVNARIIYVEANKPNELIDMKTGEKEICIYKPTIAEFCAGYGYEMKKEINAIKEDENRAEQWWNCLKSMALNCSGKNFINITNSAGEFDKPKWDKGREKGFEFANGELIVDDVGLRESLIKTFNLTSIPTNKLSGKIDKYVFRCLSGDWLNPFLWNILSNNSAELDIWDVHLGVELGKNEVKNDFDVAFMRKNTLCMIECKTGPQQNDKNADVLYKMDSIVTRFKALHVKTFLATTSDNIFECDKKTKILSTKHKEPLDNRAVNLNCTIIDRYQIVQLAKRPDDINLILEVFGWNK